MDTEKLAARIRARALWMSYMARSSHIGSCLSIADILAVLYGGVLRLDPSDPVGRDRDRFVLSKGHAAAILYAVLAERGFIPIEHLATYCRDGSYLTGHVSHSVPGVEVSTGSLGHGLPMACGMAMAGKADGSTRRVIALLSDGELDEGSNWEAILSAPRFELHNLTVIVDYNKIQSFGRVSEVLPLEPLARKWSAFRWAVREIDGHNHAEIRRAFGEAPFEPGKPSAIIAHTVKGKGVEFMEDRLEWHYRSPDEIQLREAIAGLGLDPDEIV